MTLSTKGIQLNSTTAITFLDSVAMKQANEVDNFVPKANELVIMPSPQTKRSKSLTGI